MLRARNEEMNAPGQMIQTHSVRRVSPTAACTALRHMRPCEGFRGRKEFLTVHFVPKRDCWVSLPAQWSGAGLRSSVLEDRLHAVLELTPERGQVCFACCDGGTSPPGCIAVPTELGHHLGLRAGVIVQVRICAAVQVASRVEVTPEDPESWEVLCREHEYFEGQILNQVGLVAQGQRFPIWVRSQACITLKALVVEPGPVALLVPGVALEVIPTEAAGKAEQQKDGVRRDSVGRSRAPSMTDASWWLRVQDGDNCTQHEHFQWCLGNGGLPSTGTGEKSSQVLPAPSAARSAGKEGHVVAHLTTAAAVCPATAGMLNLSCGELIRIYSNQTAHGEKPCASMVVLVAVSDQPAPGHILMDQVLRHGLQVEPLTYVRVQKNVVTDTLTRVEAIKLHPLGWIRSDEDTQHEQPGIHRDSSIPVGIPTKPWSTRPLAGVPAEMLLSWAEAQLRCVEKIKSRCQEEPCVPVVSSNRECGVQHMILQTGTLVAFTVNDGPNKDSVEQVIEGRTEQWLVDCVGPGNNTVLFELGQLQQRLADGLSVSFGDICQARQASMDPSTPVLLRGALPPWLSDPLRAGVSNILPRLQMRCWLGAQIGDRHPAFSGGVLISGCTGSGKTAVACAMSKMLSQNSTVWAYTAYINCQDLSTREIQQDKLAARHSGGVTGALAACLRDAQARVPAVVVLDDIDEICPPDAQQDSPWLLPASGQVQGLGQWLADEIDGLSSRDLPIAFIATCKDQDSVHPILRMPGRLDYSICLPPHTASNRADILKHNLEHRNAHLKLNNKEAPLWDTAGYSTADLEVLADRSVHSSVVRNVSHAETRHAFRNLGNVPVDREDIERAQEGMVPAAFWGVPQYSGNGNQAGGWEDIGGLHTVRKTLHDALELPILYAGLLRHCPLRLRTGVLLYGPPGCGKTHVVAAAVAALNVRLISVKGPELLNKYIGASEAAVRAVFEQAASASPCVVFFDEFEALAPIRGHDTTGVSDRVVNQLLSEMDGVGGLQGVCVIAATSRPDLVDPALLRPGRLDRLVLCPIPNKVERLEILTALCRRLCLGDDVELEATAAATEGFTGADLRALLSEAQLSAVNRHLSRIEDAGAKHGVPAGAPERGKDVRGSKVAVALEGQDFIHAQAVVHRSLSDADRWRLERTYSRFQSPSVNAKGMAGFKQKRATMA